MSKKILRMGKILFKLCQMLHVPSCTLLFFLISLFLYRYQFALCQSVCYAIPFALDAMGCFAINDYYDYEKDVINKPYRILPMKLISKSTALWIGYLLFLLSMVTALFASRNVYEMLIYVFVAIAAFVYGRFIDYLGKIKSIYTSIIITIPLLFVVNKCRIEVSSFFLFLSVVLYISGKELIMDIYDIKGDREAGQFTLPIIFGEKNVFALSAVAQLISLGFFYFKLNVSFGVIAFCYITLLICYYVWIQNNRTWRRFVIYCLWIPLVVCLVITI